MRSSSKTALVLGLLALAAPACTSLLGDFDVKGTSSSTSTGAGGSTATSSGDSTTTVSATGGTTSTGSATSTGAGMTDCVAGDLCADQNPCTMDSCDTTLGMCVHVAVADGPTASVPNVPKDCQVPACVGGALIQVPDSLDLPDDGNNCTKDLCTNGVASNPAEAQSVACGPGQLCDGAGKCVGCVNSNACSDPGVCKSATCDMGQCNSVNDPASLSCGGAMVCDGAGSCVECLSNAECTGSKICVGNVCITSCGDNIKNGTETDVDCGGFCQANCANGKMCKAGIDCNSGICSGGLCVAAPTCSDLLQNGTESDVDCGGSCAAKCALTKKCLVGADCLSATCTGNLCVAAAPTCTDMMTNGTESDVDCGGSCATKCSIGKMCNLGADCVSTKCLSNVCKP
jgi:hypothetical protein